MLSMKSIRNAVDIHHGAPERSCSAVRLTRAYGAEQLKLLVATAAHTLLRMLLRTSLQFEIGSSVWEKCVA